MPEQQNIEYKQNWHNNYLKWICEFANAQGGETHIGIEDKEDAPYRTDDEVVKSHELFGDTLYKKLTSKKILQSASNKKLKKK